MEKSFHGRLRGSQYWRADICLEQAVKSYLETLECITVIVWTNIGARSVG